MPDQFEKKNAVVYWPFAIFRSVHTNKDPGGITSSLRNKNYETTFIVGKFLAPKIEGIRTYETGNSHYTILSPLSQANEFFKVLKTLVRSSPDIVIAYNRNPFFPLIIFLYKLTNFLRLMGKRKTKFVLKMDSDGNFRFTNFPTRSLASPILHKVLTISAVVMFKLSCLTYDNISIESECALENIRKVALKRRKLVVIQNGCDLIYSGEALSSNAKRENVILNVSRIVRQKSLDILIEAFAYIHQEFTNWVMRLVGEIEDRDYFLELVEYIARFKLENKVYFEGSVSRSDLLNFYSTSDIFCLSSSWESDGISRREAIAAGLPVITTTAGCGDSLRKYGSIVVPVNDTRSLTNGLRLLMSDEKLRQKIAQSQKSAVVSWDEVTEMYINL